MLLHAIITEHVHTVDTQKYTVVYILYSKKNQRRDIIHPFYTDNFQTKYVNNVHKQVYINEIVYPDLIEKINV